MRGVRLGTQMGLGLGWEHAPEFSRPLAIFLTMAFSCSVALPPLTFACASLSFLAVKAHQVSRHTQAGLECLGIRVGLGLGCAGALPSFIFFTMVFSISVALPFFALVSASLMTLPVRAHRERYEQAVSER